MAIHLLNEEGRNFCGRSRTVGGSVMVAQMVKVTCPDCLKRKSEAKKSVHSREPSRSAPAYSSTPPAYDPTLDLLNPLNPLSPLFPLHDHHSPAPLHDNTPHHDPAPSHDHTPSHDPAPSHDSGGYDSGGGFDSGGGSDGGGGGGGGGD